MVNLGWSHLRPNTGDLRIIYFSLAKRYHPDRNPRGAELMAKINAARAIILNSYQKSAP
jgi:curved DNA-binding protein CbpA